MSEKMIGTPIGSMTQEKKNKDMHSYFIIIKVSTVKSNYLKSIRLDSKNYCLFLKLKIW